MGENQKAVTVSHSLIEDSEVTIDVDLDELKAANNGNLRAERNVTVAYKEAYEGVHGTWLGDIELSDLNIRTQHIGQSA